MTDPSFSSYLAASLILLGSFWVFISGLGIFRFPDLYSRMHAASKASSLGLALILMGAAIQVGGWDTWVKCLLVVFFIFATNPIAAHLISRAAHRADYDFATPPRVDELKDSNSESSS